MGDGFRVNIDYHIEVERGTTIAVPYALVHQQVEVLSSTGEALEAFHGRRKVTVCHCTVLTVCRGRRLR